VLQFHKICELLRLLVEMLGVLHLKIVSCQFDVLYTVSHSSSVCCRPWGIIYFPVTNHFFVVYQSVSWSVLSEISLSSTSSVTIRSVVLGPVYWNETLLSGFEESVGVELEWSSLNE